MKPCLVKLTRVHSGQTFETLINLNNVWYMYRSQGNTRIRFGDGEQNASIFVREDLETIASLVQEAGS